MAQSGKGKLNFRCPSCFMRDLDIDMFYDKDKKEAGHSCKIEKVNVKTDGAIELNIF